MLIESYAQDFSEFHPVEIWPDGRFVYAKLPLYRSEAGRHPFLVMADAKVGGVCVGEARAEVSGEPNAGVAPDLVLTIEPMPVGLV